MEPSSADRDGAGDAAPTPEAIVVSGPGGRLREAREAAGQSIEEIAGALHLAAAQIEAIEADDYARFPAPIFISGYVRKYAAHLGLDPEPLLASLADAGLKTPPIRSELTASFPAPVRSGMSSRLRIAMATIVVIAALAGAWYLTRPPVADLAPPPVEGPVEFMPAPDIAAGESPDAPAAAASPPAGRVPEAAAPGEESPPAPAGPMDELVLRFSGGSWVEIVDVTGRRLAYRMGQAGDVLHLRGLAPFDILLGNAPNVAIDYNGIPYRDYPVSRQNVASFTLGRPATESGDEQ